MSRRPENDGMDDARQLPEPTREILNIDEAAALLGVSVKTFNKVLHHEDMPARKIGREWKFSRRALIDWVGRGQSKDYYRESGDEEHASDGDEEAELRAEGRRTQGWRIELD